MPQLSGNEPILGLNKEALKTSHILGLEKENWLTEVKELLTPEKISESKVLRVSAPLYQP